MQVFELAPHAFSKVKPLVEKSGMRGHLALVYEVLDRRKPGLVFVDDPANPHTAFTCSSSGFFFAFGDPDEDMAREVIGRFWKAGEDEYYTTLFGSNSCWNEPLQHVFAPLRANPERRLAFELTAMPPAPLVPEGFKLQPITTKLAHSIFDGTGTDRYGIDPWFIRITGSPEAYAATDLGLALVFDHGIASIAGVCGLGKGEVELEVGTIPAYRGRGLAVVVSTAFMHQCQARGLRPAYSCSSGNTPSISVAHRLGYAEIEEIQGYQLFQSRPGG